MFNPDEGSVDEDVLGGTKRLSVEELCNLIFHVRNYRRQTRNLNRPVCCLHGRVDGWLCTLWGMLFLFFTPWSIMQNAYFHPKSNFFSMALILGVLWKRNSTARETKIRKCHPPLCYKKQWLHYKKVMQQNKFKINTYQAEPVKCKSLACLQTQTVPRWVELNRGTWVLSDVRLHKAPERTRSSVGKR